MNKGVLSKEGTPYSDIWRLEMNTILIKHGSGAPSDGTLKNYELGYVDNGALYIGYNN